MRSIFLWALFHFLSFSLVAQNSSGLFWQWVNPLPGKVNYLDIQMLNQNIGFAVGWFGFILKTDDGGNSWFQQDSKVNEHLTGVYFLDARNGWICGNAGKLLKTANGGISWDLVNAPNEIFTDIFFVNPSIGFLSTLSGKVFRTLDGGNQWTDCSLSGSANTLSKVYFINNLKGWAIGKAGSFYGTVDGGQNWAPVWAGTNKDLTSIFFTSQNEGWLTTTSGNLRKTIDGGTSWTSVITGSQNSPNFLSVKFRNPMNGVLINASNSIMVTSDGGANWISQPKGLQNLSADFIDDSTLVVVGNSGNISRIKIQSNSWRLINKGFDENIKDLFMLDGYHGWAATDQGKLYYTSNNGITWIVKNSNLGSQWVKKITFFSPTEGVLAVGGLIRKTMDGGATWTTIPTESNLIHSICFLSKNIGWVGTTDGLIYKTTNGGASWVSQQAFNNFQINSFFFQGANNGWAATEGKLLKTTNGGQNWSVINNGNVKKVIFLNQLIGFALTGSQLTQTTDGGFNWSYVNNSTMNPNIYFLEIQFQAPNTFYGVGQNGYFLKSMNGGVTWTQTPLPVGFNIISGTNQNSRGSVFAFGKSGVILALESYLFNQKSNIIEGKVYRNLDNNCEQNASETGLPDQIVVAEPGPYYASSHSSGNFAIKTDTGMFSIRQTWNKRSFVLENQNCPVNGQNLSAYFPMTGDTIRSKDFNNTLVECPYMEVSVSSNRRRICARSSTFIRYSNAGAAIAQNVGVHARFSKYIRIIGATQAYSYNPSDSSYTFNIGNVPAGESGLVLVTDSIACIQGILGQLQCTKVWITPSNSCLPNPSNWDGTQIVIEGICVNGKPRFTIKNIGALMSVPRPYRIFLDSNLAYTQPFQLASDETFIFDVPSPLNALVRVEVDQSPNTPNSSLASAEASCGFVPRQSYFQADDESPVVDEECLAIRGSFDPNDKACFPKGVGSAGKIPVGTLLDYKIRFQNTGTDTAYQVTIVDTLSPFLDIATFEAGSFSHPYSLTVSGKGRPVLSFSFPSIYLPDSNRNEPASNGFINFRIKPKAGTPLGTKILNKADIYFDFNVPVTTNQTMNTLYHPNQAPGLLDSIHVLTHNKPTIWNKRNSSIFPNPNKGYFEIRLEKESEIRIFNLLCEKVFVEKRLAGISKINLIKNKPGVYMVVVESGTDVEVKKIIVD